MASGKVEIIGTSHVAKDSVRKVSEYIERERPEIVAVELDARRVHALLHNVKPRLSLKMIRTLGVSGFLFFALASFLQKKVGRIVGISPGSDMKAAIVAAMKVNSKVALIDRSIEITMQRLSSSLGWRERLRFLADIVLGPFSREMGELGSIDLRKVPDMKVVEAVLGHLKTRYPSVYRVLVEERNRHMAYVLADIAKRHPGSRILAVVGAGHKKELASLLEEQLSEKPNIY